MISNFPTPKSYSLAGLNNFQFIPEEAISLFPTIFNGKTLLPVSLNAGFNWLQGYSTAYTLGFNEVSKLSEQGKYYEQTVSGFLPGDRSDIIVAMEEMEDQYFILLVKDPNGFSRLVGGYGCPMLFTATYDSGLNRSDSKGYTFKFYSESTLRAPVYL